MTDSDSLVNYPKLKLTGEVKATQHRDGSVIIEQTTLKPKRRGIFGWVPMFPQAIVDATQSLEGAELRLLFAMMSLAGDYNLVIEKRKAISERAKLLPNHFSRSLALLVDAQCVYVHGTRVFRIDRSLMWKGDAEAWHHYDMTAHELAQLDPAQWFIHQGAPLPMAVKDLVLTKYRLSKEEEA